MAKKLQEGSRVGVGDFIDGRKIEGGGALRVTNFSDDPVSGAFNCGITTIDGAEIGGSAINQEDGTAWAKALTSESAEDTSRRRVSVNNEVRRHGVAGMGVEGAISD